MPNQRDKDKKFVGAWLRGKLYAAVKRTARQRKISVSGWVTEQLTAAAKNPALLCLDSKNGGMAVPVMRWIGERIQQVENIPCP
jgi:hypothetical protein